MEGARVGGDEESLPFGTRVDGGKSERRDEMAAGDVGAANESVPKAHRTAVLGPVQGVGDVAHRN